MDAEFLHVSSVCSQLETDATPEKQEQPVFFSDDEEDDETEDEESDEDKAAAALKLAEPRKMPNKLLPFNKRTFFMPPEIDQSLTSKHSNELTQWPAPDIDTCRWLSMYTTTSNHMVVCHSEMQYVKNVRFGSTVYKDKFHAEYGNAYEVHINSVKLYITVKCLSNNNVPTQLYPREDVQKNKNSAAVSYLLNLKTNNGLTIMTQTILMFHAINMLSLSTAHINTIHMALPDVVTHRLMSHMKKSYSWKSERQKIGTIKNKPKPQQPTSTTNVIHQLFNAFLPTILLRRDDSLRYSRYIKEFDEAMMSATGTTNSVVDLVTHVKWLFSAIVKAVFIDPRAVLFRLKPFDSTETEVFEFMTQSKIHSNCNVVLHTRAPFTGKEHYRLNCFKLDHVHVWINSMVFDKEESNRLDLLSILKTVSWGSHHIISFRYTHNQRMKQMHIESVKLVIRYILTRRDFAKLAEDVGRHPKIKYEHIAFK
uniref:Ie-1 n=1 Tax=Spodoptera frugiperda granulovirus TaxID=307454 RepID=A0A346QVS7_9BBAC|nr:ie-1 [Spodoptera frugiperda granulovirus]